MKVLIDTNVFLEVILQREQVDVAIQTLTELSADKHEVLMSVGGFYGMLYTVEKYLRKVMEMRKPERIATLRTIMAQLLRKYHVAEHDNESLLQGITDLQFSDLEDSCQYQVAHRVGCEMLITFNIADYPTGDDAPVKVLTPQQFIDLNTNK